ncbi:cytidylyltransferase domain-containing protein [Bizionia sp.]|uniref:acylneuraminate cytidylyltransferase family protein n=1 Tax=Bizionia sp. TaxID=1954480 RepID=UPI003A905841
MKVTAFVPVKLNNERLPGKNTKPFSNGRPLIDYILSSLIKVNNIDDIYVYCSDPSIKEYLPDGIKFLQRSKDLDSDTTKINEVMQSFMNDVDSDFYVLTHATAPFIKSETIEKSVDALIVEGHDSALTVERKNEFLWLAGKAFNYDPTSIPRTQDLDPFFIETTGLYAYSKELVQASRRIGNNPKLIEVDRIEAVDINEPIDFHIANALVSSDLIKDL